MRAAWPLLLMGCSPAPPRLLLISVDTWRADHWDHRRGGELVMPGVAALGQRGRRYTQARSPAPWTLPAHQAALSGQLPEAPGALISERLQAAGWRTAAVLANPYLGPGFGLDRGWDSLELRADAPAEEQAERAISALSSAPDQPLLLFLHFMDAHLPYDEPEPWRSLWAGAPPAGLSEQISSAALRALGHSGRSAERRAWLSARYDQNLRRLDTALGRVLQAAGPEARVLLFSDHGEEWWEHGGVEHGHSLHEELLRVPLVVAAPGLQPGEDPRAASLMDVGPTVCALAGLDCADMAGRSLLGEAPPEVPLALGWTLHGPQQWGWLSGPAKWVSRLDGLWRYDLGADPGEARPLPAAAEALEVGLAAALGRPLFATWCLYSPGQGGTGSLPEARLVVEGPAPPSWSWSPPDLLGLRSPARVEGSRITFARQRGQAPPAALCWGWEGPDARPLSVEMSLEGGPPDRQWRADLSALPARAGPRGRELQIERRMLPRPGPAQAPVLSGESLEALRALGYL